VKTNRDLDARMISVQCGNSRDDARLAELRICLTRDGEFAYCGANERRSCRATRLILPPTR
jgi:ribonuclease T2